MRSFSTLTHSMRQALASAGYSLSTGHVQQLMAGAAGHGFLAAFQTAGIPNDFDEVKFWVVDVATARERARELGLDPDKVVADLADALDQVSPETNVYGSVGLFASAMERHVEDWTESSAEMRSLLARVHGVAVNSSDMPLALTERLDFDDTRDYTEHIHGEVSARINANGLARDRTLVVDALLTLPRLGKRLFGQARFEVIRDTDDRSDEMHEEDDDDRGPLISLAEALADALGLNVADTEGLEYDEIPLEGNDGEDYGMLLDFSRTAQGAVAQRIRARHPEMTLEVLPGFFDNVRTDRDGGMF